MNAQELEAFLNREERKIKQAEKLTQELDTFIFGVFDPRWWKVRRELSKVIRSFYIKTYDTRND